MKHEYATDKETAKTNKMVPVSYQKSCDFYTTDIWDISRTRRTSFPFNGNRRK